MKRKTFSVEEFKNKVNTYLATTPPSMKEKREGATEALVTVLHATGNYHGFSYIGGYRPDDPDWDASRREYN